MRDAQEELQWEQELLGSKRSWEEEMEQIKRNGGCL